MGSLGCPRNDQGKGCKRRQQDSQWAILKIPDVSKVREVLSGVS